MLIPKDRRKKYCYVTDMEVRDYELDCEQIVNNANYLHYMEHTRHCFCKEAGMPFIEMHQHGIDAVVRKIEVEYLHSLRSGDKFTSALSVVRKGPRYIFYQDILRVDGVIIAKGVVTCVVTKDGKVTRGDELNEIFAAWLS